MLDLPWKQSHATSTVSTMLIWKYGRVQTLTYLLVRVHRGKTAGTGLSTFACDFPDLFFWSIGEVPWIIVAGHFELSLYELW